jgi:hypothetical protein
MGRVSGRSARAAVAFRQAGFDERGGGLGGVAGAVDVRGAGECDAHAALDEALGLAEEADLGAGQAQGFVDAVEDQAQALDAAVDHRAGAGRLQAGVHRQAEDGAGVQLELDRKSTRLNSSHNSESRMPSSA